jgi:hypothetical protein
MKPYRATSLRKAEREVRMLRKQRESTLTLLEWYAAERKLMARLASKTPQFSNPLDVWQAEQIRDSILAKP